MSAEPTCGHSFSTIKVGDVIVDSHSDFPPLIVEGLEEDALIVGLVDMHEIRKPKLASRTWRMDIVLFGRAGYGRINDYRTEKPV